MLRTPGQERMQLPRSHCAFAHVAPLAIVAGSTGMERHAFSLPDGIRIIGEGLVCPLDERMLFIKCLCDIVDELIGQIVPAVDEETGESDGRMRLIVKTAQIA